jgi:hypothetical protein
MMVVPDLENGVDRLARRGIVLDRSPLHALDGLLRAMLEAAAFPKPGLPER